MIKLAFLDVDGVIVGRKHPLATASILDSLHTINEKGLKIILTTAKPLFSRDVQEIITGSHLDGPHITFAGALIADSKSAQLQKIPIPQTSLSPLLDALREKQLFIEYETESEYSLEKPDDWDNDTFHTYLLLRESLFQTPAENALDSSKEILKIITAAETDQEKAELEKVCAPFTQSLNLKWAQTPQSGEIWWGMITDGRVSKKASVEKVASYYNVDLSDCLGVGDSMSDWEFMAPCGYKATVESASDDLLGHINREPKSKGYIGPSVDDQGIIDILKHFSSGK